MKNLLKERFQQLAGIKLTESTESMWDAVDVSRKAEKEISNKEWNERTAKKLDILKSMNKSNKFKKDWGEEKLQGWVDQNYSWEKVEKQLKNIIKEEISKMFNEASEGELIDIYEPTRFWDEFGESLEKDIKNYKMEARGSFGGGDWSMVEMPFGSRIQYVRSRTVQPRYQGSGSDDNQLLSIVRIFIKVLTDEQYQEVKEGEKINLDGIMTITMMAEYNHSSGGFTIDESWCKWNHPSTGKVFEFDLGGGSTDDLLDYIEREIKFTVKKRGKRIQGYAFRVVEDE
jgi:hypothetical protein